MQWKNLSDFNKGGISPSSFSISTDGREDAWLSKASGPFYTGQDAIKVNDVSNQSLHLTPPDDLVLQMTEKAAFQQGLIDISSRGKLPLSIAKSQADT